MHRLTYYILRRGKRLLRSPELHRIHHLVDHPNLWRLTRYSVSGAVALGLFAALLPIPFQMLLGFGLALVLRVNIAFTMAFIFVTNPLTMGPIFYATYKLGAWLLQTPAAFTSPPQDYAAILYMLGMIWKPLLVGSLVTGVCASLLGFVIVRLSWSYLARKARR